MFILRFIIAIVRTVVNALLWIVTTILGLIFLPVEVFVLFLLRMVGVGLKRIFTGKPAPPTLQLGGAPVDHSPPDLRDDDGRIRGQVLYILIALFFSIAVFWASTAKIDEQVRAEGIIITPSDVQYVQSRLPGALTEINIKLGSIVQKGDVLFRVEDEDVLANFEDNEITYHSARAAEARLTAELKGADMPVFPPDLQAAEPDLVAQETALFQSRRTALESRLMVLNDAVETLERAIAKKRAEERISSGQAALYAEEMAMLTPLVAAGHEPRAALLSAKTRHQQATGAAELARLSAAARQSELQGKKRELETIIANFRADAAARLVEMQTRASQYLSRQEALRGKVRHAEIRAPLTGVVSAVHVKTIGAVVQAGSVLADVVPSESVLLARAQVLPQNVAAVKPGQIARLSIAAYDPSRYGVLMGVVQRVANNTTQPENQIPFYETIIEIPEVRLTKSDTLPTLAAGMPLTVDILGEKRTVMNYIMTPIQKSWNAAFREK